tara:strand:+ start:421 stop:780 length:360 start_codon:yes stop_codon:yes gene_type:complete
MEGILVIRIDFTNKEILQESFLKMWGFWNKKLLKYIYGEDANVVANLNEEDAEEVKFVIRGEYEDVRAYAKVLNLEKEYLESYVELGKSHEDTRAIKLELDKAAVDFTEKTNLPWPFRD